MSLIARLALELRSSGKKSTPAACQEGQRRYRGVPDHATARETSIAISRSGCGRYIYHARPSTYSWVRRAVD